MQPTLTSLGISAAVATLLAACATTRPADGGTASSGTAGSTAPATTQERALARYVSYAGPAVESFNWLGRFDSWEPLGKDHLLVYTQPNEAYLLKVAGPCDVRFATGPVGISSTNNTVYAGLDSIVINSGAAGTWRCPIDEIRPVDVRRMKADSHSSTQAAPAQR